MAEAGTAPAPAVAAQVLYRKWRPQTFTEVSGQPAVVRTLRNSVAGRSPAHAYLLCGPRGTGKTTLGRLLAKAVCCEAPADGEPCNICASCRDFLDGRAPDLIEMDAASNRGIEEIRRLKDRVGLAPIGGQFKVYLIDEVHMLTSEAYNALLKTLEEPPGHVIFVLATTEAHKVPPTIISRCQRFDLHRLPLANVVERLAYICDQEGFSLDEASLQEIARAASGSLRDAINTLEQLTTFYGASPDLEQTREMLGLNTDARSRELVQAALSGQLADALRLIAAVKDDGVDLRQFGRQAVAYLRELLLVKAGAADALDVPLDQLEAMQTLAAGVAVTEILAALKSFSSVEFREGVHTSLPLELAVVELLAGAPDAPRAVASPPAAEPKAPRKLEASAAPPAAAGAPALAAAPEPLTEPETLPATPAPVIGDAGELLEQVRAALKETNKQVAGLLNGSCEVLALGEDTVTLGVYFKFHLDKLQSAPVREPIEEAMSRIAGRKLSIVCEMTEPRSQPSRARKTGPLANAALDLGAVLVEDE